MSNLRRRFINKRAAFRVWWDAFSRLKSLDPAEKATRINYMSAFNAGFKAGSKTERQIQTTR